MECQLILASTGEVFASGPFDNVTGAATFALSNYHVAGLHSIVATSIPSRFSSAGAAMTVPVDVLAAIVPNAPPNQARFRLTIGDGVGRCEGRRAADVDVVSLAIQE